MKKEEILSLLRENGGYISGQELCERFGVSRTAVWKAVNQLKEEGYDIEAVRNKGYRLAENADVFNRNELENQIHGEWAGRTIYFYPETGSTNTDARKLAEQGAPHGTVVAADRQNAGKGRRGRTWQSPPGKDIYFTILLRPEFPPDKAPMLTLVMALSVAEAVNEACGIEALIKWPNDITVNGKKICGILTEMNVESDYIRYVITGVGINVNRGNLPDEIPDEIRASATSLILETGKKIKRAPLLAKVLERMEVNYGKFVSSLDLCGLLEDYNRLLVNRGKTVCILDPKEEFEGTAEGITPSGELIVRKQDGTVINVYAGEVSIRGLYGYT